MAVSDEISTYHDVVAAGQIDCGFALRVLSVEEMIIFDGDVMRLIELDQIKTVVVL